MATLNLTKLMTELKGKRPSVADTLRHEAERFWESELDRDISGFVAQVSRDYARDHRGKGPAPQEEAPLPQAPLRFLGTAAYAMLHILSLGAWQGKRQGEIAHRAATALGLAATWDELTRELSKLTLDDTGTLDLPEYLAEQLKFPAAFARTFGIQPEYAALYVAERIPPIVDMTVELQTKVRDAVGAAGREAWNPEDLEDKLRRIGNVTTSRAHNQMRTESAHMFVRGRMESFTQDPGVVAYRFHVIEDANTTDICRAHIGKVIAVQNLTAIPPFHYQCRTEISPVYEWEGIEAVDQQPGVMEGFGQRDWVEGAKGRVQRAA